MGHDILHTYMVVAVLLRNTHESHAIVPLSNAIAPPTPALFPINAQDRKVKYPNELRTISRTPHTIGNKNKTKKDRKFIRFDSLSP